MSVDMKTDITETVRANALNKQQVRLCQDNPFDEALSRAVGALQSGESGTGDCRSSELAKALHTLFSIRATRLRRVHRRFEAIEVADVVQECLLNFFRYVAPNLTDPEAEARWRYEEGGSLRAYLAGVVNASTAQRMNHLLGHEVRRRGYRFDLGRLTPEPDDTEDARWWEVALDRARSGESGRGAKAVSPLDIAALIGGRGTGFEQALVLAAAECCATSGHPHLAERLLVEGRTFDGGKGGSRRTIQRRRRENKRRLQVDFEM